MRIINYYKYLLLFCLAFNLVGLTLAREIKEIKGQINEDQPISMGDYIYRSQLTTKIVRGRNQAELTSSRIYTYSGIDDDKIMVGYEYYIGDDVLGKDDLEAVIKLSLDHQQAILKVKTLDVNNPQKRLILRIDKSKGLIVKEAKEGGDGE